SQSSSAPSVQADSLAAHAGGGGGVIIPPPHSSPVEQSLSPQSTIESQSLSLPSAQRTPNSISQQLPVGPNGSVSPSHGPHSANSPFCTHVCVPSEQLPIPRSAGSPVKHASVAPSVHGQSSSARPSASSSSPLSQTSSP